MLQGCLHNILVIYLQRITHDFKSYILKNCENLLTYTEKHFPIVDDIHLWILNVR